MKLTKQDRPLYAVIAAEAIYMGLEAAGQRHNRSDVELHEIVRAVDADPAARRLQLAHMARLKPRWEAAVIGASESLALTNRTLAAHIESTLAQMDRDINQINSAYERAQMDSIKLSAIKGLVEAVSAASAQTSELVIRRELVSARISQLRQDNAGSGSVSGNQAQSQIQSPASYPAAYPPPSGADADPD